MEIQFKKFGHAFVGMLFTIAVLANGATAGGESYSLDGFKEIKVAPGLAEAQHLIDTVRPFLINHPESLEGRASVDLTIRKKENGYIANIIKSGYLDDSVKGEHFRGFIVRSGNGKWKLISMGVKYDCYRSKSTGGTCS